MERLRLNPMADEFVPPLPMHEANGNALLRRQQQQQLQALALQQQQQLLQAAAQLPADPGPAQGGRGPRGGPQGAGGNGGGRSRGHSRGSRGSKRGGGGQKNLAANVRRTIYICDINSQVTEEQLASHFSSCGSVVDCRVCGDPNSAMRFAFIEFTEEAAVQKALQLSGTMLGSCPLRVLRSKTAIVPVNHDYLPRSHQERELCVRTVYAANIDKKVEKNDVRHFFESFCGRISRLRLLGDYQHATRIAFIEFEHAEAAMAALNCSGAMLGSLPIRVSPSKTPVRSDPRDGEDQDGGRA
uniref:Rna binding protein n=1 Tax=Tetraselmis sp. GSL018 TaxID=582737 RepID=A0A061RRQ1_9CHLO|mmetsp:Transcript_10495/g.24836  ORF Transcript_10495/g.24836 Transcript_10495/m.24836 type:complete len:299 (-) Transcript_10495:329-1225(-)